MCFLRVGIVGVCLSLTTVCAQSAGSITAIAVTGDDAWGIVGARIGEVHAGPTNDSGAIAFTTQLQEGFGGVGTGDDEVIWQFDGSTTTLRHAVGQAECRDCRVLILKNSRIRS